MTFLWNAVQYVYAAYHRSGRNLGIVGIVDLALGATLISGVVYQHRFLPSSYGECSTAASWNNGPNGQSFFGLASADDPNAMCYDMVRNWILAVVVIILYLMCGFVNIVLGFGQKWINPLWDGREERDTDYFHIYWYLWIFGIVRLAIFTALFAFQLSISTTRFAFRYTTKYLVYLTSGVYK